MSQTRLHELTLLQAHTRIPQSPISSRADRLLFSTGHDPPQMQEIQRTREYLRPSLESPSPLHHESAQEPDGRRMWRSSQRCFEVICDSEGHPRALQIGVILCVGGERGLDRDPRRDNATDYRRGKGNPLRTGRLCRGSSDLELCPVSDRRPDMWLSSSQHYR